VRRLAVLIGAVLVLMALAFLGFAQAAAKDETTTIEGLIFFASIAAFPILVVALLVLLGLVVWRFANRSAKPS
jgi:heme/copper-type cytochrome/quinol oxidase subunit 2